MPDQNFFKREASVSLKELAERCQAHIGPNCNPAYRLEDVAPLDTATEKDVSFLDNIKYKEQFLKTKAGACIVSEAMAGHAPEGVNVLISRHPYKSYALAAQYFYPDRKPEGNISERAHIDSSAHIGKNCTVEAGVVIQEGAQIGDESWIEAGAVIGRNVKLGRRCRIGVNANISHCLMGDDVRLYPGVRIGQDGFGFAIDPAGHVKVPQLGRVIIEDHVEIGANTCIDRGAGPDTVIGQGTWIDNLVQIGHNVKIGKGCVIVALAGISGSTIIEDFVVIGGQAGITGHLKIGRGAQIGAQSGVMRDVPPGEKQLGTPALPIKQSMRQTAFLNRMIKKDLKT